MIDKSSSMNTAEQNTFDFGWCHRSGIFLNASLSFSSYSSQHCEILYGIFDGACVRKKAHRKILIAD